jgi:DNA primase
MDAIAVTIASQHNQFGDEQHSRYFGVAPMGTSLTTAQTELLCTTKNNPIIATDADIAGQKSAARDYWQLTVEGIDPQYAYLPEGTDPASLLQTKGAADLVTRLAIARPMVQQMIDTAVYFDLTRLEYTTESLPEALAALAASNPARWEQGVQDLSDRCSLPANIVRARLRSAAEAWNTDPDKYATNQINNLRNLESRLRAIKVGRELDIPEETLTPLQLKPTSTIREEYATVENLTPGVEL